jgi:hypothetical protein
MVGGRHPCVALDDRPVVIVDRAERRPQDVAADQPGMALGDQRVAVEQAVEVDPRVATDVGQLVASRPALDDARVADLALDPVDRVGCAGDAGAGRRRSEQAQDDGAPKRESGD